MVRKREKNKMGKVISLVEEQSRTKALESSKRSKNGFSYLQEADHYRQLAERYIVILKGCQEQNMRS